jgi:hypothetical protein
MMILPYDVLLWMMTPKTKKIVITYWAYIRIRFESGTGEKNRLTSES